MISDAEFVALRERFLANAAKNPPAAAAPPKRHKYGVAPKDERTLDGIVFASRDEMNTYVALVMMQRAGEILGIERQPRFAFPMGFSYIGDFRVKWADGRVEVIDVKGFETPVFKLKLKCMAHFYPDVLVTLWRNGKRVDKGRL